MCFRKDSIKDRLTISNDKLCEITISDSLEEKADG